MINLSFHFDGGLETYGRSLNLLADKLKSFRGYFEKLIEYFESEGTGLKNINGKGAVITIYESQGSIIGSDWSNSPEYEMWKDKYWNTERIYDIPISGKAQQIFTGKTLYSLLHSDDPNAIRQIGDTEMTYGTSVAYAYENQTSKKILDLFPEMIKNMDRTMALWLRENNPELTKESEG